MFENPELFVHIENSCYFLVIQISYANESKYVNMYTNMESVLLWCTYKVFLLKVFYTK